MDMSIQRHVGFNDLLALRSPLVFGSNITDRFATLTDPPVLIRTEPAVVRVKDDLFDRFAGLAEMRTRRALPFPVSSPVCSEVCGIMLDRRLPFSLRTGPMFDRRLPELLLVKAKSALAFPVEGARLLGELGS